MINTFYVILHPESLYPIITYDSLDRVKDLCSKNGYPYCVVTISEVFDKDSRRLSEQDIKNILQKTKEKYQC